MNAARFDLLLANAAEVLLLAMRSEPGSADERRYMRAVQVFMTHAENVQRGAA
jgi:hypothetical protein